MQRRYTSAALVGFDSELRRRHFVTTGTALLVAGLAGAGGTAASNIYGAKKAARVNERSIDAQSATDRASIQADRDAQANTLQIQREQLAQQENARKENLAATERARQDAMGIDREHWNTYVESHRPMWQTGQRVFSSLMDLAGGQPGSRPAVMPEGGAPAPVMTNGGAPSAPAVSAAPTGGTPSLVDVAMGRAANRAPSRGLTIARQLPRMAPPSTNSGLSLMDLAMLSRGGLTSTNGLPLGGAN